MQMLPLDSAAITADWLTDALSARHPGVRVASVDVLHERSSTNHHVRLGISYDERAGLPDTMFAKMASPIRSTGPPLAQPAWEPARPGSTTSWRRRSR